MAVSLGHSQQRLDRKALEKVWKQIESIQLNSTLLLNIFSYIPCCYSGSHDRIADKRKDCELI